MLQSINNMIVYTQNGLHYILARYIGNPQHHLLAVQKLRDMVCEGEPSLHNSLELAAQTLR
jgi:hypothetical protein